MGVALSLSRSRISRGTVEVSENNIIPVLPNIKTEDREPLAAEISPNFGDDETQVKKRTSLLIARRPPILNDNEKHRRKQLSPLPRRSPSLEDDSSTSCSDRSTTSDNFVLEAVVKSYHYDQVLQKNVSCDRKQVLPLSNTSPTQIIMAEYSERSDSPYFTDAKFSRSHKDLLSQFIAPTETVRQKKQVVPASSSAPSVDITSQRQGCSWGDEDDTRFKRKSITGRRKPDDRPIINGMAPIFTRETEQQNLDHFIKLL